MDQETIAQQNPPPLSTHSVEAAQLNPTDKNWAVAAHLASVVGWVGVPCGHILAPLVVWLVKKDESEFVRGQAIESLNFQISMTIYGVLAAFLMLTVIGIVVAIPAIIAIVVGDVIFTIVGAMQVSEGKPYRYPLTIRLLN